MAIKIDFEIHPIVHKRDIRLLEAIDEFGSVTTAAKSIGITYYNAWNTVAALNRKFHKPLVQRSGRGLKTGDAVLTDTGREFLRLVHSIAATIESATSDDIASIENIIHESDVVPHDQI